MKGDEEDLVTFYDFKTMKAIESISFDVHVNEMGWDLTGSVIFITTSRTEYHFL